MSIAKRVIPVNHDTDPNGAPLQSNGPDPDQTALPFGPSIPEGAVRPGIEVTPAEPSAPEPGPEGPVKPAAPDPAVAAGPEPEDDPFDPARLRLSQDFAAMSGVRKLLTTVPVMKPSKESFVRVHPDPSYRLLAFVLELKDDREVYLVDRNLVEALGAESSCGPRLLLTAVTRQGVVFLWPVKMPGPDGKLDSWNQSILPAVSEAERHWVRVSSNMALKAYEVIVAEHLAAQPAWPAQEFKELLRVAFRDRLIDSLDHPVLRRLRGEV